MHLRFKSCGMGNILILAYLIILVLVFQVGCAGPQVRKEGPAKQKTLDELMMSGARIMWVAAHPDDESMAGPILAKAGPMLHDPLFFFVMTHGDGGECRLRGGCHPDLKTVRGEEMKESARLYQADLEHESYYNASLPFSSFPPRPEIAKKWVAQGDPTIKIAKAIRQFKPTVVLTFDPDHGFTGHPEHQLVSRFATQAVRMADDPSVEIEDLPWFRVERTYYVKNHFWVLALIGKTDPGGYSETFNATQECSGKKKCRDVMAEYTRAHKTQAKDMGLVRRFKWLVRKVCLYQVDPWSEPKDPFERVK